MSGMDIIARHRIWSPLDAKEQTVMENLLADLEASETKICAEMRAAETRLQDLRRLDAHTSKTVHWAEGVVHTALQVRTSRDSFGSSGATYSP